MPVVQLIIFGIPVLSLVWWIWADRCLSRMGATSSWRIGMGLVVLVLLVGFAWVLLARWEMVTMQIPAALYALVLLWGLIFLPFVGIPTLFGWSLGSLGLQILRRTRPAVSKPLEIERKWSRREWLAAAALSLPVTATYGTTAFFLPRMTRFRIQEMTLFLNDLPAPLDGMRIAHVTDTHVGKFTRGRVLDEIVAATNRLDADLVLFTGDLIDNTIRDLPEAVATVANLRDPTVFPILLAHHPHAFDHAAKHGISLTLAGHTHGGQMMLNKDTGAGPSMFRYWSGLYEKAGRALVVSNGTGNWFPVRMNAPAEIIHLTLKRA